MKVLHITNNYPTIHYPIFGIFLKEQINSITSLGIENEVFFINGREKGRYAYWSAIKQLRFKLNSADYDVLHCHHVYSAIILILTMRSFNFKKIVSYQNDPEREGGKLLFRLIHFLFDAIILKNKSEILRQSNTYYLPNGVNIEFFKPYDQYLSKINLKLDFDKNYILFMDSYNIRTQKRIDRFNQVIYLLQKNGNPNRIEPLILTNTNRDLIPYYICASKLHLLTSDFEGSPNSIKECLACNIPIVTTPVGNVDDLIGDVEGSFISKTFEAEELAELVLQAIKIEGFNGRSSLIKKQLDINTIAIRLKEIYEKII